MTAPATAPKPAPAPKPAAAKPSVAAEAAKNIASAKTGTDPMRPLRYGRAFITGTIGDGLDGMANWGRRGLKWGAIAGIVTPLAVSVMPALVTLPGVLGAAAAFAAGGFIAPVIGFAAVAFAAGVVLGAAHGLATGGMRAMNREIRRDTYAEDLVQRAKVQKAAPAPTVDYRQAYYASQQRKGLIAQQLMAREDEKAADDKTYWQSSTRGSHGGGRGF